jgi:hypothetical protein
VGQHYELKEKHSVYLYLDFPLKNEKIMPHNYDIQQDVSIIIIFSSNLNMPKLS